MLNGYCTNPKQRDTAESISMSVSADKAVGLCGRDARAPRSTDLVRTVRTASPSRPDCESERFGLKLYSEAPTGNCGEPLGFVCGLYFVYGV